MSEKFGYEGNVVDFGAAQVCAGRAGFGNYVNRGHSLVLGV